MWTGFLPLFFSQSDMHAHTHSRHRVCSCKPSPLPPTSLSLSVPLVLALTLTCTLQALFQASHQKERRRASHRGRGEGPADRIWSSSACGENDLEDSETESRTGKHRLEYPLLFQAQIFALEPRRWDKKKKKKKKEHTRTNERKSNAGRLERRTRKCIPAPSPELSAMAHSSFFPPSREPPSLAFLSIVPSLSFSPLPPPHAVARVHMRPYDFSLFLSLPLSGDCSASHPRSLAASSVFLPPGRRNTRSYFLMVPPPLCVPP